MTSLLPSTNIFPFSTGLRTSWVTVLDMCSMRAKEGDRVVVVIDGLQYLSADEKAFEFGWLPETLPQNVKIILSITATHESYSRLKALECSSFDLEALSEGEAKELVRTFLNTYHKKLCEDASNALLGDQMALLMSKGQARIPL